MKVDYRIFGDTSVKAKSFTLAGACGFLFGSNRLSKRMGGVAGVQQWAEAHPLLNLISLLVHCMAFILAYLCLYDLMLDGIRYFQTHKAKLRIVPMKQPAGSI